MGDAEVYTRKYPRMAIPFIMKILAYNHRRVDSEYCTCAKGINISPGGVSFKYPRVISEGDHLRVLIHSIRGMQKEEIMANIRITWAETKDILSKRFGGRFIKIAPDKKYKLMKLTRRNGGR